MDDRNSEREGPEFNFCVAYLGAPAFGPIGPLELALVSTFERKRDRSLELLDVA